MNQHKVFVYFFRLLLFILVSYGCTKNSTENKMNEKACTNITPAESAAYIDGIQWFGLALKVSGDKIDYSDIFSKTTKSGIFEKSISVKHGANNKLIFIDGWGNEIRIINSISKHKCIIVLSAGRDHKAVLDDIFKGDTDKYIDTLLKWEKYNSDPKSNIEKVNLQLGDDIIFLIQIENNKILPDGPIYDSSQYNKTICL
jgi:hypothetical protein